MKKEELIEEGYDKEEIDNFIDTYGEENLDYIDEILELENRGNDPEMIKAGIVCGISFENMEEAYEGQYDSDEDFVQQLLEETEEGIKDLPPYIHIDWEWTAQDIMMDYCEENGYYFRS
jgi:antirestriction protein